MRNQTTSHSRGLSNAIPRSSFLLGDGHQGDAGRKTRSGGPRGLRPEYPRQEFVDEGNGNPEIMILQGTDAIARGRRWRTIAVTQPEQTNGDGHRHEEGIKVAEMQEPEPRFEKAPTEQALIVPSIMARRLIV